MNCYLNFPSEAAIFDVKSIFQNPETRPNQLCDETLLLNSIKTFRLTELKKFKKFYAQHKNISELIFLFCHKYF